jgi:hypothetical protein
METIGREHGKGDVAGEDPGGGGMVRQRLPAQVLCNGEFLWRTHVYAEILDSNSWEKF